MTITNELTSDPKELLAIHLYVNTPLFDTFLVHIPEGFVSKIAVSFSNSWYDVTDGLASAEQLKPIISPLHALLSMTDVVNCTFSGLSTTGYTKILSNIVGCRKLTAVLFLLFISKFVWAPTK